MPSASDEVGDHLNPDESLVAEYTATLSESSSGKPVSVGITDRRVLCVSEREEATSIGYGSICTIRSHPWVKRTYHVHDYRLFVGGGGLMAIAGLIGVMVFSTTVLVPMLTVLTIGSLGSTEFFRRNSDGRERTVLPDLRQSVGDSDRWQTPRRIMGHAMDNADEHRTLLLTGGGLIGMGSFVGALLVASSVLVPLSILVLVSGITVVDYAYRNRDDFDGIHVIQQQKVEVSIRPIAGPSIHLNCDPADEVHQELSMLVFTHGEAPTQIISTSPSDMSTQ